MSEVTAEEIEELLSDEPFGCECDDDSPCCSHADQAHILLKLCRKYRAAVAAERERVGESWNSMRDEILHGDGTLDNDQTNWVLSIVDDHDERVSNPESRKRMSTEYAPAPPDAKEE